MKYNEFYREPTAQLLFASPLKLVEVSARNCYDSFKSVKLKLGDLIYDNYSFLNDFFRNKESIINEYIQLVMNLDGTHQAEIIDEDIEKRNHGDTIRDIIIEHGLLFKFVDYIIPNTKFIREVGINKNHSSILEHATLHFRLGFPRNVLQEISRHRIGVSPSIKSTRYTLTELRNLYGDCNTIQGINEAKNSINNTIEYLHENYGIRGDGNQKLSDNYILDMLNEIYVYNGGKLTNDFLKNILPEHWWTSGHYTINLRAFKHMMELRLNKSAFMPFRRLTYHMYNELPQEYKDIFQDDFKENLENINTKWLNEDM